ncbi:MAG: bifunctional lysine ketoglutarate reductase /saccharopine dehydrogenase family protein [Planctomycetota bacterium]
MIGIRREDKSPWEARTPLVPGDVRTLIREHGVAVWVQRSPIRRFRDAEFTAVGAELVDDLAACPVVLGVKQVPPGCMQHGKTYVFFSHTIKGQPQNMPMLRRLMELGCQLIDYERIVDEQGRRLVFFGRYAGLAGMIDALWALGNRLEHEGIASPFAAVRRAFEYDNLHHATRELARVGAELARGGVPPALRPFICGFAGYGHVSTGAQEIFDLLPVRELSPAELPTVSRSSAACYKVVFREEHMVAPRDETTVFELQDYYHHPHKYCSAFFPYVHYLTILVNGIYWDSRYPKLVTVEQLRELFGAVQQPRLRVIADISCDIGGAIESTVRPTDPGDPVYVFDPETGQAPAGVVGRGPVVLAVDALPCELPLDASTYFSRTLLPFLPPLDRADFARPLDSSGLPPELAAATILYHGELTERYRYLEPHLAAVIPGGAALV